MAFLIPGDRGCHFASGPFPNCILAIIESGIGGESAIVGVGDDGATEYDAVATLWNGDIGSVGPLGPFLFGLLPSANAAIKDELNAHPLWAPVTAADPPSVDNANKALAEYFTPTAATDGTYVQLGFRPYP